ncbi:MAG: site-specific DNA-methyltransferase [Opitutaceae bacterium]|nr:site-specific DNA-methyltransferase [Opitutaceae bacterium]
MIRAYRDTWTLGVHSYLAYLKQRLILARELLSDSGSIFVQISDENLHRVRAVMDEVFGSENHSASITFLKTTSQASNLLPEVCDYLLWYSKDRSGAKFRRPLKRKEPGGDGSDEYTLAQDSKGAKSLFNSEARKSGKVPDGVKLLRLDNLRSQGATRSGSNPFFHDGVEYPCGSNMHWKTNDDGLKRLSKAERLFGRGEGATLCYLRYFDDFAAFSVGNVWTDMASGDNQSLKKLYTVQTLPKVIQRCMLMVTDPGDLVLDPTCGSGTTAFVAEQWGRRWITIDSSRVAVAIARQRILTACFDTYKTKDPISGVDPSAPQNPAHGFCYKTVPHITLKSIAQNKGLDAIFARHESILAARLTELNAALAVIAGSQLAALSQKLVAKLLAKHITEGANAVTDADQRRCFLPGTDPQLIQPAKKITDKQAKAYRSAIPPTAAWREWEVPFDADPDWPAPLAAALTAYRTAWRAKMDEVNAAIAANAEQEELVDQPELVKNVVRVSGPFTVESMRPPETSLKGEADESQAGPIGGAPGELEAFESTAAPERDVANAASHVDRMLSLLKHDGLTFLGNKHAKFTQLDRIESSFLHAEGELQAEDAKPHRVAVVIGPEFGSVTSFQVENALRVAHRRGYDDLVFAGFSFDATAQETIQAYNDEPRSEVRIHMAQIRPDVSMKDLLKKTLKVEQIFTVFGQPRTRVEMKGGEFVVHMDGVDLYDPVANALQATSAGKVAAWFIDTDYDNKVFCICQAFFPDKDAWEKLARALKTTLSEGAFEALTGTTSLPFKPGPRQCIAIKVIDPRGNEVMRVHRLDGKYEER